MNIANHTLISPESTPGKITCVPGTDELMAEHCNVSIRINADRDGTDLACQIEDICDDAKKTAPHRDDTIHQYFDLSFRFASDRYYPVETWLPWALCPAALIMLFEVMSRVETQRLMSGCASPCMNEDNVLTWYLPEIFCEHWTAPEKAKVLFTRLQETLALWQEAGFSCESVTDLCEVSISFDNEELVIPTFLAPTVVDVMRSLSIISVNEGFYVDLPGLLYSRGWRRFI